MSAVPPIRDVRELMAELELLHQRDRERDAKGWCVVTVDDEFGHVVHASGLFDSPEEALVYAGQRDAEDARGAEPGEPGWTHSVVPMFAP